LPKYLLNRNLPQFSKLNGVLKPLNISFFEHIRHFDQAIQFCFVNCFLLTFSY
jgi:hypothetical protein